MAIIEIEGVGRVEVGDEFLTMTPDQQAATVDEIAAANGPALGAVLSGGGGAQFRRPPALAQINGPRRDAAAPPALAQSSGPTTALAEAMFGPVAPQGAPVPVPAPLDLRQTRFLDRQGAFNRVYDPLARGTLRLREGLNIGEAARAADRISLPGRPRRADVLDLEIQGLREAQAEQTDPDEIDAFQSAIDERLARLPGARAEQERVETDARSTITTSLDRADELRRRASAYPTSPAYQAFVNAAGPNGEITSRQLDILGEHPRSIIGETALQSLPNAAFAAGGVAAGALTGGGVPGAVISGLTAMFGANAVEYGPAVTEGLQDLGIDINDREAVMRAFADPAVLGKLTRDARISGNIIGATDAVTAGLAGALFKRPLATVISQLTLEPASEAGGEALKQLATGTGEINETDVLMEGFGGFGSGAAQAAPSVAFNAPGAARKWLAKRGDQATLEDLIEDAQDGDADAAEVLRGFGLNDRQINAMDEGFRERLAAAGDEAAIQEAGEAADAFALLRRAIDGGQFGVETVPRRAEIGPGTPAETRRTLRALERQEQEQPTGTRHVDRSLERDRARGTPVVPPNPASPDDTSGLPVVVPDPANPEPTRLTPQELRRQRQLLDAGTPNTAGPDGPLRGRETRSPMTRDDTAARRETLEAAEARQFPEGDGPVRATTDAALGGGPYSPASRPSQRRPLGQQPTDTEIGDENLARGTGRAGLGDRPFVDERRGFTPEQQEYLRRLGLTNEQIAGFSPETAQDNFFRERAEAQAEAERQRQQEDLEAEWARRQREERSRFRENQRARNRTTNGRDETGYTTDPGEPEADGFYAVNDEGFLADANGRVVRFRSNKEAARWAVENSMGGYFDQVAAGANSGQVFLRARDNYADARARGAQERAAEETNAPPAPVRPGLADSSPRARAAGRGQANTAETERVITPEATPDQTADARARTERAAEVETMIDELEALGTPDAASFAKGLRGRAGRGLQRQEMVFYRQRVAELKAQAKGTRDVPNETHGLDEILEPATAKRQADLPIEVNEVLSQADQRIQGLTDQINEKGYGIHDVDARAPADVRELRREISEIAGTASRVIKQHSAVARGYKRANPDRAAHSLDELRQMLDPNEPKEAKPFKPNDIPPEVIEDELAVEGIDVEALDEAEAAPGAPAQPSGQAASAADQKVLAAAKRRTEEAPDSHEFMAGVRDELAGTEANRPQNAFAEGRYDSGRQFVQRQREEAATVRGDTEGAITLADTGFDIEPSANETPEEAFERTMNELDALITHTKALEERGEYDGQPVVLRVRTASGKTTNFRVRSTEEAHVRTPVSQKLEALKKRLSRKQPTGVFGSTFKTQQVGLDTDQVQTDEKVSDTGKRTVDRVIDDHELAAERGLDTTPTVGRSARFSSNPALDPELIKDLIVRPTLKGIQKLLASTNLSSSTLAQDLKAALKWMRTKSWREKNTKVKNAHASALTNMFATYDSMMRDINKKLGDSAAVTRILDMVWSRSGHESTAEGSGLEESIFTELAKWSNRIGRVVKDLTPAQKEAVVRVVRGTAKSKNETVTRAADQVREFLADMHDYLREAGVDLGRVARDYFPREYDPELIQNNPDLFKKNVAGLYQRAKRGLPRKDAEAMAEALYEELVYGEIGGPGRATTANASFFAGRAFDSLADKAAADGGLADFMVSDLDYMMIRYVARATKRAEIARRFGDKFANWAEIADEIRAEGAGDILPQLHDYILTVAGSRRTSIPASVQKTLGWVHTFGNLGLLEQATFTSIPEVITPALRAGRSRDVLRALTTTTLDLARHLSGLGRRKRLQAAMELAEDLGIIASDASVSIQLARWFGGDMATRAQAKTISGFFRLIRLEQFTNYTRGQAVNMASVFIRRLAKGSVFMSRERAAELAAELGIPRAKQSEFFEFVEGLGDTLPTSDQLTGDMGRLYKAALARFTDQSIMRPNAATKPKWASHPIGKVIFALQAFGYTFYKQVLSRNIQNVKAAGRQVRDGRFLDAAGTLASVPLLLLLPAFQFALSAARDDLDELATGREKRPMTLGAEVERAFSRGGLLGAVDPYLQVLTGTRFNRSTAQTGLGPIVGGTIDLMDVAATYITRNSAESNATERALAKEAYQKLAEPAFNAILSRYGVNYLGFMLAQAGRYGEPGATDAIAGPDKPNLADYKPIESLPEIILGLNDFRGLRLTPAQRRHRRAAEREYRRYERSR